MAGASIAERYIIVLGCYYPGLFIRFSVLLSKENLISKTRSNHGLTRLS